MRDSTDAVVEALDELRATLDENVAVINEIKRRIDRFIAAREAGLSCTEIVSTSPRPLIVELVTGNLQRLASAGSKVRRAEAAALHGEGQTMDAIATMFGVTRQRVSALLKQTGRDHLPANARRRPSTADETTA